MSNKRVIRWLVLFAITAGSNRTTPAPFEGWWGVCQAVSTVAAVIVNTYVLMRLIIWLIKDSFDEPATTPEEAKS